MIEINEYACPSNHHCPVLDICPSGAIEQENYNSAPYINKSKCTSCKKCLRACPFGAFISSN